MFLLLFAITITEIDGLLLLDPPLLTGAALRFHLNGAGLRICKEPEDLIGVLGLGLSASDT